MHNKKSAYYHTKTIDSVKIESVLRTVKSLMNNNKGMIAMTIPYGLHLIGS